MAHERPSRAGGHLIPVGHVHVGCALEISTAVRNHERKKRCGEDPGGQLNFTVVERASSMKVRDHWLDLPCV